MLARFAPFLLAATVAAFATSAPMKNPCKDSKPKDAMFTDEDGKLVPDSTIVNYFDNKRCADMMDTGFGVDLPQSGMDVTADGAFGALNYSHMGIFEPILTSYADADPPLCPVNVHWHLGAEHRSAGEYDEAGSGPYPYEGHVTDLEQTDDGSISYRRRLAAEGAKVRQGLLCHHYDSSDAKFTTPYDWKYCVGMEVGQTYEVHWPHSAAGDCGTEWQFQTPFYDGVFCNGGIISLGANPPFNVNKMIGVEGQVFTIVNDDDPAYQADIMGGAWKDATHWADVATYIGSTTGTSRDNEVCSFYAPITWKVDRKCHMISAASFDAMCKKMKLVGENGGDDMKDDLHAHGARELVNDEWTSDTVYRRKK